MRSTCICRRDSLTRGLKRPNRTGVIRDRSTEPCGTRRKSAKPFSRCATSSSATTRRSTSANSPPWSGRPAPTDISKIASKSSKNTAGTGVTTPSGNGTAGASNMRAKATSPCARHRTTPASACCSNTFRATPPNTADNPSPRKRDFTVCGGRFLFRKGKPSVLTCLRDASLPGERGASFSFYRFRLKYFSRTFFRGVSSFAGFRSDGFVPSCSTLQPDHSRNA